MTQVIACYMGYLGRQVITGANIVFKLYLPLKVLPCAITGTVTENNTSNPRARADQTK